MSKRKKSDRTSFPKANLTHRLVLDAVTDGTVAVAVD